MSQSTKDKLEAALEEILQEGTKINPNAVTQRAGCTTAILHYYPELYARIKLVKEQQKLRSLEHESVHER